MGTTLIEELEQAAKRAEATGTIKGKREAVRLRTRAERVRELEVRELAARPGSPWSGPRQLLDAITSDLPEYPASGLAATPGPPAVTERCPACNATTKCGCDEYDVLGAIVEQHPIPSSRGATSAPEPAAPLETPGDPREKGPTR